MLHFLLTSALAAAPPLSADVAPSGAPADPRPPGPGAFRWSEARDVFQAKDPRRGHDLGFGSVMGLQGVSGLQVGVRLLGVVHPTLTVSPLLTVDLTVHVNLLPTRWSPEIGAGFVYGYPYNWGEGIGSSPRCGFAHYDVGADFTPDSVFTFTAGLTVADVDCSTTTQILPLPYVGVAWYLGR